MKFLIASDIHGSNYYMQKVVEQYKKEGADKIILLGDIYNHGPRNPLPTDYAPLKVADTLNEIKDNLIVVKGNCDSQVDTLISNFNFNENCVLVVNNKTVFLTHGHIYNKDNLPSTKYNAIIYGHFHTGFIQKQDGLIVANAGSVSLPKNNTKNSYLILEDNVLTLKDIQGSVIAQENI